MSIKCAVSDSFASQAYARASDRIKDMNNENRSGDIILIMKDLTTATENERYSTGYACKAWHGSLNPGDSFVPFIVTYPAGNKSEVDKLVQNDTVCKIGYSNCTVNWKLADIVKGIISEQNQ